MAAGWIFGFGHASNFSVICHWVGFANNAEFLNNILN